MTRKTILGAALLVAAVVSVIGAEAEFSAERIKAHVTFLADDLLEGREAGTRGHEIAARYVATQLALLGVRPGGQSGTYFQTVSLLEAAQIGPEPSFVLTTPGGDRRLKYPQSAIVHGPTAGGAADVRAPMVFVGYGMQDAAVGYDDYDGLDAHGKIVVVLFGAPKGMDSEVGAHLQSQQARVAAAHGATAIVSVATRAFAAAVPWEKVIEFATPPTTTWVREDGTPFDPNYGMKASAVIEVSAAEALFAGAPRTLTQILDEADTAGGRPRGFPLKSRAHISASTRVRRFSSPEVIGVIEGADPALKDEYIALMGHVDHIGVNAKGTGDRINNGALDNAAGAATLIEVAHAFTTAAARPRRSILVIANTGEEKGLLGAEYFAHYPTVPIERVAAAIDLDMPMLLYDFTDVVAYGSTHSSLERVFREAGAALGVTLSPDPMPEQAIFVRSDHYAMVKAGVPAVMLATGMANGGQAAWGKYLANNYHQPSDDLSQPIVWNAAAKFAELNYRVVRSLADADSRPQWYAKDYFGDLYAPKAAKVPR